MKRLLERNARNVREWLKNEKNSHIRTTVKCSAVKHTSTASGEKEEHPANIFMKNIWLEVTVQMNTSGFEYKSTEI